MCKLNPDRKEKLSWASSYLINCKYDQSSIQAKVLDFILHTRPSKSDNLYP